MTQPGDERIPAALRSSSPEGAPPAGPDPLKYCIFTTVALLAWLAGPLVVMALAAMGVVAYGQAIRRGQRRTRCLLRDTRLVVAYLAAAFILGVVGALGLLG